MLIKMLKTTPGSIDGLHVKNFKEGTEFDAPDNLAKCFIDSKCAVEIEASATEAEPESKEPAKKPEVKEEKQEEKKDEIKEDGSKSDTISKKR